MVLISFKLYVIIMIMLLIPEIRFISTTSTFFWLILIIYFAFESRDESLRESFPMKNIKLMALFSSLMLICDRASFECEQFSPPTTSFLGSAQSVNGPQPMLKPSNIKFCWSFAR